MKEKKEDNKISNLYILLIIVALIWFLSIFAMPLVYTNLADRGVFGDSFGVINSLFSGLAFAGIIYTILLQRKELKLQRDELELTREELAKSADAQIASQKELAKQSLNMKRTAELNALSTLIDSLTTEIEYGRIHLKSTNRDKLHIWVQERENHLRRVKHILNIKAD